MTTLQRCRKEWKILHPFQNLRNNQRCRQRWTEQRRLEVKESNRRWRVLHGPRKRSPKTYSPLDIWLKIETDKEKRKKELMVFRELYAGLSLETLAYIAGIIDGEGAVHIRQGAGKNSPYLSLVVTVASTSKELVDWMIKTIPKVVVYPYKARTERQQPFWHIYFTGLSGVALLERTLAYMTIKKTKAELVVEMFSKGFWGGAGMPRDEMERRKLILLRFAVELDKGSKHRRASWPAYGITPEMRIAPARAEAGFV